MMNDIIIIGAGIIGSAIARELSRYNVSILVLESGSDVASGATKANSGIVHAGYDPKPGTKKAYYNVQGSLMYPELCASLGLEYVRCGDLVIGFGEEDRNTLDNLLERGRTNGVKHLRIIEKEEILGIEPNINPNVVCALDVTDSAIVSPYEVAFALADDAALNGVKFIFEQRVVAVNSTENGFEVDTDSDTFSCRVLINCSGSSGAVIHNQISDNKLHMTHRRGQYYLLDRTEKQPFSRTIFQCPSQLGKGVLVSPTVHGNLIIGPTAEDIVDPLDTNTTADGLADVLTKAKLIWPDISVKSNITNFSGIRAHLDTDDFVIGPVEGVDGAFEAIGIESPGLSSAPAIATDMCKMVVDYLALSLKNNIIPYKRPSKTFRCMSDLERRNAIIEDPLNGRIVCRCEMVTEAEIREAVRRPVGARSIDAVKRRTRAGMGRCQGGFCSPRVAAIIAEETGMSMLEITKNGGNGFLLTGTVEDALMGDICDG